ncbi:MAG TPA: SCO family protein [Candidatus Binataceae bacterium]|nr:SCO family protein [Candidatus Binataceae bacterium]
MRKFSAGTRRWPSVVLAACLAIAAIAGCENREAPGDYPATNTNDCLPNVTLLDQSNTPIALPSLKGKPIVIDFIYTSCESTCPMLTAKMVKVAKEIEPLLGDKAMLVSISIDPEHDRPSDLAKYAAAQNANRKGWLFLTGTPGQIDVVMKAFGLRRKRESDGSITHSIEAYLLGPDGHQLRQYNALEVSPKAVAGDVARAL